MSRVAGVLMPITSLPSPYGIGTVGKAAYEFADFLKEAGQKVWQILPVGPTSYGDSPYQSFSSFAGNPYMIDLDMLKDEGLLLEEEYNQIPWQMSDDAVNYGAIYYYRFDVLRKAYARFKETDQTAYRSFTRKNSVWLKDYALYMSVKAHFDNKSWTEWEDEEIRLREPKRVEYYKRKLREDIAFWQFLQFKFFEQWYKFREYVNSLGIKIMGDMPIYVAMDSADTWANPDIFWLDSERKPVCVAGCPPDAFSDLGQLWGNPLYNWDRLRETGYRWWFDRIESASKLFDITRIDHFRAFDSYYAIPVPAENAKVGNWMEGPGLDFFTKMKAELGDIPIVAEDLGDLTPGVYKLMEDVGYPGMKILEFAFGSGDTNPYLPHNYKDGNCIVYTGTHDNDPIMGWKNNAQEYELRYMYDYTQPREGEDLVWALIRLAYSSKADYAIIQMQDLLSLGSESCMNHPGLLGGNWTWRIKKDMLTLDLAQRMNNLAKETGR